MTYCSETISTWSISSLIVISLQDCPLDSWSHCQEQKEVKEWGRFWLRFEASLYTELVGYYSSCLYIKGNDLEGSRNTAKEHIKRGIRNTKDQIYYRVQRERNLESGDLRLNLVLTRQITLRSLLKYIDINYCHYLPYGSVF